MSDDVQRLILSRRARFVALALAGVGCTPGETAPPSVVVPPAPAPDASVVAEDPRPDAAVVDASATAPTSAGDAGVSAATQLRYDRARTRFGETRARLVVLEGDIAKARPLPAGKPDWLAIVQAIAGVAESTGMTMGMPCPSPDRPETTEYLRWLADEGAKVQAAIDAVRAKAWAKLKDKTMTGEARYEALLQETRNANPRPCLSIACDHW